MRILKILFNVMLKFCQHYFKLNKTISTLIKYSHYMRFSLNTNLNVYTFIVTYSYTIN